MTKFQWIAIGGAVIGGFLLLVSVYKARVSVGNFLKGTSILLVKRWVYILVILLGLASYKMFVANYHWQSPVVSNKAESWESVAMSAQGENSLCQIQLQAYKATQAANNLDLNN